MRNALGQLQETGLYGTQHVPDLVPSIGNVRAPLNPCKTSDMPPIALLLPSPVD